MTCTKKRGCRIAPTASWIADGWWRIRGSATASVNLLVDVAALAGGCVESFTRPSAGLRHRDGAGVHVLATVLRERPGDRNLVTDLQRFTAPAAALQTVRRTHFGAPVGDLTSLLVFDVDVEPHV